MEGQYSTEYEASLNPWTDWRQKERQSRRRRLGIIDRFMYEAGQLVYSSPCAPLRFSLPVRPSSWAVWAWSHARSTRPTAVSAVVFRSTRASLLGVKRQAQS